MAQNAFRTYSPGYTENKEVSNKQRTLKTS